MGKALEGELLDEIHVEMGPNNIPGCVRDKNIDVNLIRKFFTLDDDMRKRHNLGYVKKLP